MNTKARKDTGTHGGAPLRIARFSFCHLLGRGRMLAAAATNRARKSNGVRLSAKSLAENTCQFGGHKRLGLPFNTELRLAACQNQYDQCIAGCGSAKGSRVVE